MQIPININNDKLVVPSPQQSLELIKLTDSKHNLNKNVFFNK